ncbi:hypothetical protein BGW38_001444 [Lunasporangiospora selenospora]|uniref:Uncharacterized protein n=1 Tax=Lunasporangiospora selenospora TaxID=979761 RepID=A0A9P6FVK7_9FUNG|nr:hypothetical protein BGW38_001444 [Lunasporangiospora selenospora]
MTKLQMTPPLVNLTPLTEITEVPIHLHNPIHPNSANKHKRLGLQILNELSRIEMLVTRIETVGKQEEITAELAKNVSHLEQTLYTFELENGNASRLENTTARKLLERYMIRSGLAEMFPKSSEYLGIDPVVHGGGFLEAHFRQMSCTNQLVSLSLQLQNDIRLTNHKYMAHQIALLYQCINQAGPMFSKYRARVEENFNTLKEISNKSEEPQLPLELQTWLSELTTDIVADALYSGHLVSQQTPEGAHLSEYIDRVSSGNTWEEHAGTA